MMKIICLVLFGLAMASANPTITDSEAGLENLSFKEKQTWVLKLFNNIMQNKVYKEIEDVANNFKFENNMEKFTKTEVLKRFVMRIKEGKLPRGEIFCLSCRNQMNQVIDMFHVLFYSKDFATFLKVACWMRIHMNEGMFVYALTLACRHRHDCRMLYLPAPYEIYPYFFVRGDVIQRAYMMKMNKGLITDNKMATMYGITKTDKGYVIIDENIYDRRNDLSTDDRLRYFTEDIDLNTYYYYFHIEYPFWMGDDLCENCKTRRGEIVMYYYQQLLARYYLERLSNNMCEISTLSWHAPLKTGYWPWLRYHNGIEMPMRMNNHNMVQECNKNIMDQVEDYETMIRQAIVKGYFESHDGTRYSLKTQDDIENLAKLINMDFNGNTIDTIDKLEYNSNHNNVDKINTNAQRYLITMMKSLVGFNCFNKDHHMGSVPTALDNYQTAIRDPVFYQLMKRIIKYFMQFKLRLPAYSRDDLNFPGVKINNIAVDKLVTYFDDYLMDMSNIMVLSPEELAKRKFETTFLVRKRRLNHEPFSVKIELESDKAVDAVVRLFIGPKKDCMNNLMNDINKNRYNFVEIDTFVWKLNTGKNLVDRKSIDMRNMMKDRTLTKDIHDKIVNGEMSDLGVMYNDIKNIYTGFPVRLLLPKGNLNGLDMLLYVIVTPLRVVDSDNRNMFETIEASYGSSNNAVTSVDVMRTCRWGSCLDKMPLGFPFDREIDIEKFFSPNMRFIDIRIFHKNVTDSMQMKYYNLFYKKYHMDKIYDDKMMSMKMNMNNMD